MASPWIAAFRATSVSGFLADGATRGLYILLAQVMFAAPLSRPDDLEQHFAKFAAEMRAAKAGVLNFFPGNFH